MTPQSWNTVLDHTSDAGFRAWGSELSARLAAIGAVQTADTGQVNWLTATRPGTGVATYYEVWRFDDPLQATAPIFFKVRYGTSGSAPTRPSLFVQVGTGSNGSGTLTGQLSDDRQCANQASNPTSTIAPYASYACHTDGNLWVCNKINSSSSAVACMGFFIGRTCDASGAYDDTGFVLYGGGATSAGVGGSVQFVRTLATAQTFTAKTGALYAALIPHAVTSSLIGADNQAFVHWVPTPKILPVLGVATMILAEAPVNTLVNTALVGTTPHDYISLGSGFGDCSGSSTPTATLMIYE